METKSKKIKIKNIFGFMEEVEMGSKRYIELKRINDLQEDLEISKKQNLFLFNQEGILYDIFYEYLVTIVNMKPDFAREFINRKVAERWEEEV